MKRGKDKTRSGSAFLIVLVVMLSSLSMVTGVHYLLLNRTTSLRMAVNDQALRNGILIGLQQAILLLADDDDLTVDSLQDEWMRPKRYQLNNGVMLTVSIEDAQKFFNLNHLSLSPEVPLPRTYLDMFESIITSDPALPLPEPFELEFMQSQLIEKEIWLDDPATLSEVLPPERQSWSASPYWVALPRQENRPLSVNLNTVEPTVLQAIVGPSLQAWTDTILSARENEPLRNVAPTLETLPQILRPLLTDLFDVNTQYMIVTLQAETDFTLKTCTVLLHRKTGGEIEVMRCQW